jgi:hypothetical protein
MVVPRSYRPEAQSFLAEDDETLSSPHALRQWSSLASSTVGMGLDTWPDAARQSARMRMWSQLMVDNSSKAKQVGAPFVWRFGRAEFLTFGPLAVFEWLICSIFSIKYGGLIDPLERALIDAVLQKLDRETAGIMRKQLSEISHIMRNDETRSSEDLFRRAVWLFVRFKSKEKLIPQHDSADFAVVEFRVGKVNVKAKFSALFGELFSRTYSKNVKSYRGSKEISILSVDTSITPTDAWS